MQGNNKPNDLPIEYDLAQAYLRGLTKVGGLPLSDLMEQAVTDRDALIQNYIKARKELLDAYPADFGSSVLDSK